jgi:Ca-activated chloride channel family protein
LNWPGRGFALLPLPWLARLLLPAADSGEPVLKVGFLSELEGLAGRRARLNLPPGASRRRSCLWLLLLCAAARPQWLGEPVPMAASGRDLLVAVDVSGRWTSPTCSGRTKTSAASTWSSAARRLSARPRRRPRGLILFGSQAYLQAPLTFDRHTVRTWLDEARIGIAGKNTAIGDAIGLAVKRLRQRPAQSRVLMLITDGANNGGQIHPLTAARLAARKACASTPSASAPTPKPVAPRPARPQPEPGPGRTALKEIADITHGAYFRARDGAELHAIGTPSTSSNRWPSNRPRRARPRPCTPGPWPWRCC